MKTIKQVLQDALKLIRDKNHWLQGTYASTIMDEACYCAVGAIRAVCPPSAYNAGIGAIQLMERIIFKNTGEFSTLETYNDTRTHDEVVRLFKQAIRIASKPVGERLVK